MKTVAMQIPATYFLAFFFLLLTGCGQAVVKTTANTPLTIENNAIPESQLLDLGVITFDPGLDNIDANGDTTLPEVRNAEALYLANQLADTIQRSAAWGAVRVVPGRQTVVDVYVKGRILQSDGETLKLAITASDTSGRQWYRKNYKEVIGKYAYEKRKRLGRDPFQGIFNRIANDLSQYRQKLAGGRAEELRTISELRFARDFAPEAYNSHIAENRSGRLKIRRLPAVNDPILNRIQRIRERDYLYVDTLQEHYDAFSRQMETPYQTWRSFSYEEILSIRELRRQSRIRTIAGVAVIVGGVVAAGSDNRSKQVGGAVAASAGGLLVKSGLSKRAEAQIHVQALLELGQSLEAEIEPQVIELEDRTITLTGNVESQYAQWKAILGEIYRAERSQ